jgi:hypothetical protein
MTREFGRAGQGKRRRIEKTRRPAPAIKKGQLLAVKAPPYYEKEYLYEVTGAGDKSIRATLYHSPKVRKSWTAEEFALLLEMGIVRLAGSEEAPSPPPKPKDAGG